MIYMIGVNTCWGDMMAELLTISEAASKMHVTNATIYNWIKFGRLRLRIPEDELTEPVVEQNEPGTDENGT